jgi:hypothetical protein
MRQAAGRRHFTFRAAEIRGMAVIQAAVDQKARFQETVIISESAKFRNASEL